MAFNDRAGPDASAREIRDLLALLHEAGHTDFRDARGPMGFTQRQAAGRFTRDEAAAFIAQLRGEPGLAAGAKDHQRVSGGGDELSRAASSETLADELRRRGWTVTPPAR